MTRPMVAESCGRIVGWRSLLVDLDHLCIRIGVDGAGGRLPVSPAEFGLLSLLLRRRNVPLSKEAILVELFGPGHGRDGRQVDVFVARLCRTLRGAGVEDAIVAVAGRGYAVLDERAGCAGGGQPRADREVMAA